MPFTKYNAKNIFNDILSEPLRGLNETVKYKSTKSNQSFFYLFIIPF